METMFSRHSPSPFGSHSFKSPITRTNPMWSSRRSASIDESSNDMLASVADAIAADVSPTTTSLSPTTVRRTPLTNRRIRPAKTFFCPTCQTGFTRRSSLNKHVKNKHNTLAQMKYCPYAQCSFATRNAHALASHRRLQHSTTANGMLYFCRACRQRFADRRTLLAHLSRQHASDASLFGRHETNETASAAVGTSSLADSLAHNAHVINRRAKEEPEADMPHADEQTPERSPAPMERIVEGEMLKSNKSSPSRSTRQQEKSMKSDDKKHFDCDECSFKGKSFRSIFTHRRLAHAVKETYHRHSCVHCRRPFKTTATLAQHIKSCRKRYACDQCDFGTSTKRALKAHMTAEHTVVDTVVPTNVMIGDDAPTTSAMPLMSSTATPDDHLHECVEHLNKANASMHNLVKDSNAQLTALRQSMLTLLTRYEIRPTTNTSSGLLLDDRQRRTVAHLRGDAVDAFVADIIKDT